MQRLSEAEIGENAISPYQLSDARRGTLPSAYIRLTGLMAHSGPFCTERDWIFRRQLLLYFFWIIHLCFDEFHLKETRGQRHRLIVKVKPL